jgi:hypothetical protein
MGYADACSQFLGKPSGVNHSFFDNISIVNGPQRVRLLSTAEFLFDSHKLS